MIGCRKFTLRRGGTYEAGYANQFFTCHACAFETLYSLLSCRSLLHLLLNLLRAISILFYILTHIISPT